MEILKLLDRYIEQLDSIVSLTDDKREALIEDVIRVVVDDDSDTLGLDYYHSDNPDFLSDARRLKVKLEFQRASIIDANEKAEYQDKIASEQRELEKLRLQVELAKGQITIQNTNYNENNNTISVSFDTARKNINEMTSLSENEIKEILRKIDELEKIVKSTDGKSKKWSNAKDIIKWIADKGVDVGIALLPLLLKIS